MSEKQQSLWHPRHWPTWIALGFARSFILLPYPAQMSVGRFLGDVIWRIFHSRRRVVEINLDICFPQWSESERQQKVREHFRSAGMGLMETFICWWSSDRLVRRLAHYEGLEHLQSAMAQGKGVILLSAHFTSLELGVRMSSLQADVTAMYKPPSNPVIDRVMRKSRERIVGKKVISKYDIRSLIRSLRDGKAVWYASDQSARNKFSAEIPFFGHPALTNLATNRLAKISKAPVVPFFTLRREDGKGYRIIILPALENFPGDDEVSDALRINHLIEDQVRQAPAQYFWLHKRFKRQEGPDVYA